jgi:ABC-2 type transport system permease protein
MASTTWKEQTNGKAADRLAGWLRRVFQNPVTLKELRGRMRGRRAFVVLTIYLLLMSGIISLIYLAFAAAANDPFGPRTQDAGKVVFGSVVGVQVFLVLFVAPAFTAGAISGEKERQTFDLLRTTLLSSNAFVGGKLLSALSYVLLLVFASIPLQSIAFLLGGITASEVLISQLLVVAAAVAYALIGLFLSSTLKSTLSSTVATYAISIFLTVGLPILALLALFLMQAAYPGYGTGRWMWEIFFSYFLLSLAALNLPAALVVSEVFLLQEGSLWGFSDIVGGYTVYYFSPWYVNLLFSFLVAFILYRLTVRRVRKIAV